MVVTGDEYRDNTEVDVKENMDNNQSNGEMVPIAEQNNDEGNVRIKYLCYVYHVLSDS